MRSDDAIKPGSVPHRFRKWMTADVLPSIRKTGSYGAAPPFAEERVGLCRESARA